jgi:hypothetical protein
MLGEKKMTVDHTEFALYGTHEREPESRELSAGPLTATLQGGNLRTIRFMGHEVLRAVAFLVRDKDWGTCAAEIRDLVVDAGARHFSVRYRARYAAPSGARLDCEMHISGSADGRLAFEADCVSDADFETARAGFTVLHPVTGVAGQKVAVEHSGGSVEQSRWPELIDPWQPFVDIAAITHGVAEDIEAVTRFTGDVFEMEDQRNWTDGSYKTYVRPLALPWPYLVRKGEKFSQGVELTVRAGAHASPAARADEAVSIAAVETDLTLPEIGIGLRPDCLRQEIAALVTLARTGATHLIAHFDPLAGHGLDTLKGYAEIAKQSGLKVTLELALPCIRPPDEELSGIAKLVSGAGLTLDTLFVSPSVDRQSTPPGSKWPACPPLADVYAAARKAFPGLRLGGGMMSYFTELNRKRAPGDLIDYVSHATCPIVHAADDLSVMQTFEALRYVVKSVRAIYGDKPYRIGPSTIAMRQNPYGSATKDNPALTRIPMANVDPRHNGRFGAAWTLAYAATVASAGLEVLTLSTLAGPFGLVAGKREPLEEGGPRPLAHVIAALGAMSGQTLQAVKTSRPDAVLGLGTATTMLLANITPAKQSVALSAKPQAVEILEDRFHGIAASDTIELGPYACARISL